jgi:hypothetical protein
MAIPAPEPQLEPVPTAPAPTVPHDPDAVELVEGLTAKRDRLLASLT